MQQTSTFTFGNLTIRYQQLKLKLKRNFNTAHSSSSQRVNFLVKISFDGISGFGQSGLPPKKPKCYLADLSDCKEFMLKIHQMSKKPQTQASIDQIHSKIFTNIPQQYFSLTKPQNFKNKQAVSVYEEFLKLLYLSMMCSFENQKYKAARSALEFAIFDLWSQIEKKTLNQFIFRGMVSEKSKPNQSYSFYTISYENEQQMFENVISGLSYTSFIKIKYIDDVAGLIKFLNRLKKYNETSNKIDGIIVDANASWNSSSLSQCILLINQNQLNNYIVFIEQPFPIQIDQQDLHNWKKIKDNSNIKLIVDESFAGEQDIPLAIELAHGVNIKTEKAGGPINTLRAALKASENKLEIIFGTMVSSHLGCCQTFSFGSLSKWLDADGSLLVQTPKFDGGFRWKGSHPLEPSTIQGVGIQRQQIEKWI